MGLFNKVLSPVTGAVNGVLSPLGLGGEQGEYYTPQQAQAAALAKFANADVSDSIEGVKGFKTAAHEVTANPAFAGMYGEGGLQSQLANEGNRLSSQGFSLQPQDYEAYGQTAGDVARLFGQQEQAATQSLARRGLASADSGAAGATFSGLSGNKNEMLAKAQMQIAQQRMQDTQNRLQQNRQLQLGLGQQMSKDIGDQYDRQVKGYGAKLGALSQSAGAENSLNDQLQKSQESKDANKGHTLFDALGGGLFKSASNIGSIPGKVASSAAGRATAGWGA